MWALAPSGSEERSDGEDPPDDHEKKRREGGATQPAIPAGDPGAAPAAERREAGWDEKQAEPDRSDSERMDRERIGEMLG